MRTRLMIPAWAAGLTMAACVIFGVRGWAPLAAFSLAAFAGAAAIRQLVLATRASGTRGLLGRANGGMIVHLGVVVIAVAFSASQAYGHRSEFQMHPGDAVSFAGHHFVLDDFKTVTYPNRTALIAEIQVDGGGVYRPAISNYTQQAGNAIATPSIDLGPLRDVYLSIAAAPAKPGDPMVISIIIQPLVGWLWVGGALVALGTLLAIIPGRRRRPVLPASAPARIREPATTP
jgi:cytochrome c-type biogenesis protein CcmF